jgi:hypothetical protein
MYKNGVIVPFTLPLTISITFFGLKIRFCNFVIYWNVHLQSLGFTLPHTTNNGQFTKDQNINILNKKWFWKKDN